MLSFARRSVPRLAAATAAAATAAATAWAYAEPSHALQQIKTESVTLQNGRKIAYQAYGDPDGIPVLAFHGMSSSHLTWETKTPLSILAPGVQLIAIDRPGYGDSTDPPAGYSYSQFVEDLEEFADALDLHRFCVAGHSSGGPYALALAAKLPERVLSCAAISSDPPYNHPRCPDIVRLSDSMASDGKGTFYGRDPVAKVSKWRRETLESGDASKRHAWKPGVLGFVTDFALERLPYSFKFEDITLGSRVTFWYGTEDYPPMIVGSPFMQSLVPGSQLRPVQGATHRTVKAEPTNLRAILLELRDQAREALQRDNALR